jgi:uncharacterized NAD-dependent epimerase/dehydratase family protein
MGARTNPDIQCAGISINTSGLPVGERTNYLAALSKETSLPCVDPLIEGCDEIVEYIRKHC